MASEQTSDCLELQKSQDTLGFQQIHWTVHLSNETRYNNHAQGNKKKNIRNLLKE